MQDVVDSVCVVRDIIEAFLRFSEWYEQKLIKLMDLGQF